jgi:hypothetical protein
MSFDEGQEDGDWMEADWMLEYAKREAETSVQD